MVKTLITGSVRGQSLEETLSFMQKNVLGANKCYLPETIKMCNEMNEYTEAFCNELVDGMQQLIMMINCVKKLQRNGQK